MGKIEFWMGILLAAGSSLALAQGDVAAGKQKAETCGSCHGQDGNSSAPIFPKLAGQHAAYLAKQLHNFKTQGRPDPTMSALSEPLTDADIADLSAYYAAQKIHFESPEPSPLGEKLYRTGNLETGVPACTGCHGPEANGNPHALFPALNGQYAAYIEKTLKDFKAGTRTNDMNQMMRIIAGKMSDAEIAAVADHISGLK